MDDLSSNPLKTYTKKGKASPKVKMSNSYAKGFDRVLKEIDGIVKKIKASKL